MTKLTVDMIVQLAHEPYSQRYYYVEAGLKLSDPLRLVPIKLDDSRETLNYVQSEMLLKDLHGKLIF